MTRQEIVKEIRTELKKIGITNKQVSVTGKASLYDDSIRCTIKDLTVPIKTVEEIAHKYESIRYDEACGEILQGCNTFITVTLDYSAVRAEREKYMEFAKNMMEQYKDTPEGQLETIAIDGDLEILYMPKRFNGSGELIEIARRRTVNDEYGEWISLDVITRYAAYNECSIAEGLVYFINNYGFKLDTNKAA